jgi:hypothetical protein
LYRGGECENQMTTARVGDVSITVDRKYCFTQASNLLGMGIALALRSDEVLIETDARFRNE